MPTKHAEKLKNPFQIVAHRGFKAHYAENTLISFEKAIEAGATMLELDVRMTQDEVVVILHDPTLLRLGGHRLHVSQMSWSVLKTINLMDKKARHLRSGSVLTLEQLFERFGNSVYYDVEIKTSKHHLLHHKHQLCNRVIDLVARFDLDHYVMATCFELDVLQYLHDNNNLRLGYNFKGEMPDQWLFDKLKKIDARLCPHHALVTEESLSKFKEMKFKVIPWVVNSERRMHELLYWGVDGIISDNPEKLTRLLERIGKD